MKYIFSNDDGFGCSKYAYRDKNGQIKMGKVNSSIALAPDDAEDMPIFEGRRYYVGDIALMEDYKNIINVLGYKDHEKYAPLLLAHTMSEANIKPDEVGAYAFGLSLAQKSYIDSFVKRMSKFSVDGVQFDLKDRILMFPQGIAARYVIDDMYYANMPDKDKNYAIIDIGQLTVDVVSIFQGKTREENAAGVEQLGIVKITNKLEEFMANSSKLQVPLSIKELQNILEAGKYTFCGEEHDFSKTIAELKKEYTKFLLTSLMERHKKVLQKIPKIYVIGGGAYYLDDNVLNDFPGFPSKIMVKMQDPEYMNAVGGLLGAEKFIAQGVRENLNIKDFLPEKTKRSE